MLYRADPATSLQIVALDSLSAVYHRPSGQTHIVTEPVPEILQALSDGPVDVVTLLRRLGIPCNDQSRALLIERLDELVQTGLVCTE